MTKRLYRSRQQRILAGVCGGLGEYFDVDPVFVRILAVVLFFAHGVGLIAYIVAWIAMPKAPLAGIVVEGAPMTAEISPSAPTQTPTEPTVWGKYWVGIILIA